MKALIVGLSGPSSSGKSTLARLLRSVFNIELPERTLSLFVLYEDDFYKPNEQIPVKTFISTDHGGRDLQDWDCAEAMDFPLFERTLSYVKEHGMLPADMYSKEDQNELGESHIDDSAIQQAKSEVELWFRELNLRDSDKHIQLCVVDGFLLYSDPAQRSVPPVVTNMLDLKLFLRTTLAQMIERRGKRAGYVTLGDFWVDPPGYVEDVVWTNYVKEHAWMFWNGDVDNGFLTEKAKEEDLVVAPGMGDEEMDKLMAWCIKTVKEKIEQTLV